MSLCTPDDIRNYLGLTVQVAPDTVLQPLCDAAESFVLSYLNRDSLEIKQYTETYNGTGTYRLCPRNYPITEVSALSINGIAQSPSIDYSSGFVFGKFAVYLRSGIFCKGAQNVSITYKAGYEPVPASIKSAAIDIAASKYSRRNRFGVSSKTIGQESISYRADDMTPFAEKALEEYVVRI